MEITMIKWDTIDQRTMDRAYWSMAKIITAENYGTGEGQWTLTEMVQTEDARRYNAFKILDGIDSKCNRVHGLNPLAGIDGRPFRFKFRVLTRQACVRTCDGKTVFRSKQAMEESGEKGILPDHLDKPVTGDVVEWKGQMRTFDSEKGRKVDAKVLKEWAMRGIRPETYLEFVVDKGGCIEVPYPYALSMLTQKGKSLAFPRFAKQRRTQKTPKRRITNWWFEEVAGL
jgi:hypothetical protein